MGSAGTVGIDLEPNLPALGSRIEGFARNLRPLGLRVDIPDFGRGVEEQAGRSRRAVDSIDTGRAQAQLRSLGDTGERELGRIGGSAKLSSEALLTMGAGSIYAGTRILGALRPARDAASELNEVVSYSQQVFGASQEAIDKWADNSVEKLGASRREVIDGASTFATYGKAANLAGNDLVKFSTGLVGLATDLASARGGTTAEAIEAIGSALRGEMDPIERYGVLLQDATLRQEAFALGLTKTTKDALTPQQRVLAVQSLLFKQTADAQGDWARNGDNAAGSAKKQAAEFEDMQAKLGQGLLPLFTAGTKVVTAFVGALDKIPGATSVLGGGLAIGGTAAIVGGGITSILGAKNALVEQFGKKTVEAGVAGTAANESIAASATAAAAAESGVAAAYDAVAAAATRATAASTAASAATTAGSAASVGSSVVLGGSWQYARPRTPPALGPGPVIDVASREVPALASGVTAGAAQMSTAAAGATSRLAGLRAAATSVGSTALTAFTTLGGAAQAAGAVLAAVGIGEAVGGIANELRELDRLSADAMNRFAGNIDEGRGKVLAGFDAIAAAADARSSIADVARSFGREFSFAGVTDIRDIEYFQEAFDRISAERPVAEVQRFIDAARAQNDQLDHNSVAYKETEKLLNKWQESTTLAADAADTAGTAVAGLANEVERLGVKIDPTASKWQQFSTVLGGIASPVSNLASAIDAFEDGQAAIDKAQQKYDDIVNGNTEGLKAATEALTEARDALNEAVAKTGPGSQAARDAAQSVRDAFRAYRDLEIEAGKTRQGDFFDDRTADLLDAKGRIQDALDKLREVESGNSDEVTSARERLADAEARYQEELGKTGANSQEAIDAAEELEDLQLRQFDLYIARKQAEAEYAQQLKEHPEAVKALNDELDRAVATGLINVATAKAIRDAYLEAGAAAETFADELPGGQGTGPIAGDDLPTRYRPGASRSAAPSTPKAPEVRTQEQGAEIGLSRRGGSNTARDNGGRTWKFDPDRALWVAQFAQGGVVRGFGSGDTVPAMLTPGEGVVNTRGMGTLGADGLAALNSGAAPSTDVVEAINGLRGDVNGLTALLVRQGLGGGADLLAPLLQEGNELLRRLGTSTMSPAQVRAMALEWA